MSIFSSDTIHMNSRLRVIYKPLKEFVQKVDIEIANLRANKFDVKGQARPPREINHNTR